MSWENTLLGQNCFGWKDTLLCQKYLGRREMLCFTKNIWDRVKNFFFARNTWERVKYFTLGKSECKWGLTGKKKACESYWLGTFS